MWQLIIALTRQQRPPYRLHISSPLCWSTAVVKVHFQADGSGSWLFSSPVSSFTCMQYSAPLFKFSRVKLLFSVSSVCRSKKEETCH